MVKCKTLLSEYNSIVHAKTNDIYKDIADVKTRFDTSKFELDTPFPNWKNKKVIGLIKDALGGKIMKELVGLRAKTYSSSKDNNDEDKKIKDTKKNVIKIKLKFHRS